MVAALVPGALVAAGRLNATDFDQLWVGARALLAGADPYVAVPAAGWPYPLLYPLPAVLLAMPLAAFPLAVARLLAVALMAGALAYAVTRDGWERLPLFASASFLFAAQQGQLSPVLAAAFLVPWLGIVFAAKPTTGGALWLARPTSPAIWSGVALLALSFILRPLWPGEWIAATQQVTHVRAPIVYPGGVLALLALLRWRRPEARVLAFLACAPQTFSLAETVPLISLVPASRMETLVLAFGSWAAFAFVGAQQGDASTLAATIRAHAPYILAGVYLPALVMVLRRPNVAPRQSPYPDFNEL